MNLSKSFMKQLLYWGQWTETSVKQYFQETLNFFNPLKPKPVDITFKNSICTSKGTPKFTITKINWWTLFKEIITVYLFKKVFLFTVRTIQTP
jgi:hypothetical protein